MRNKISILLAVILGVTTALGGMSRDHRDSLLSVLPDADVPHGWSRTDSARIYGGKDLYLFIDGGADLFFEYGFRQALAAEYRKGMDEAINLEIYEMTDSGAAFGIYSVRSGVDGRPVAIGQAGSAHAYYFMFWKGRYYISVAASDSTTECKRGLEAIARAVDRRLSAAGKKPGTAELLPRRDRMNNVYFRGYLGLSSARLFDMKEMFPAIDGAVGTYPDHAMIYLKYSSESEAQQRLVDITGKLRSDERFRGYQMHDQMAKVTDRRNQTVCVGRSRSCIIISVSSKEAIAESSYVKAVRQLRGH